MGAKSEARARLQHKLAEKNIDARASELLQRADLGLETLRHHAVAAERRWRNANSKPEPEPEPGPEFAGRMDTAATTALEALSPRHVTSMLEEFGLRPNLCTWSMEAWWGAPDVLRAQFPITNGHYQL